MEGVSIIIPTLNEAENIDPLLERIHTALAPYDFAFEIVFSDGASVDMTREVIELWQNKAEVRLVENEQGKGLAAAVISGARAAKHDFLIVMDADLSHPPEVIPGLLEPLMSGRADMVVGSRYVRGGSTPDWPVKRKIISRLATLPARMFTHIKDPLSGFIAVRRERLAKIEDEVCGFKIGLELLATAEDDVRVHEVPIAFSDRRWGQSKLSTGVVTDYIKQLAMLVGISLLPGGFKWLFPVFLTVVVTDSALFTAFLHYGIAAGWAHCLSFLPAAALGGVLGVKTLARNDIREVSGLLNWYFIGTACVCLLTLFLRSGVVATSLRINGELTTAFVFYFGLLSFLGAYSGIIFWVHSLKKRRISGRQLRTYYGLGVVFYLMLLRLAYIGGMELLPEEQYYYQLITQVQVDAPAALLPAPALLGALGMPNFPELLLGFRLGVWLLWLMTLGFIFSLARDMYDRQVAFALVLLFSIVPFFFAAGFFVTNEAVLTLIWCAALYLIYRAIVTGARNAWILAGIIIGAGLQLDVRLSVMIAGVLVYLCYSITRGKLLLSLTEPYLGLAAMLLTFLPAIIIKGGRLAVDVSTREVYSGPVWVESLLGGVLSSAWLLPVILLTPTVLAAGVVWAWLFLKAGIREQRLEGERADRHRLFLIAFFGVPFLLFLVPGLFEKNILCAWGLVWGGLMPTIAALMAFRGDYGTSELSQHPGSVGLSGGDSEPVSRGREQLDSTSVEKERVTAILRRCWWPTVCMMLLIYGAGLHLMVL
ncbi:glycosyltransferase [Desulfosediminicola sp.]|uniref:glycosyltransferase n=1 Tax=Desulfosediminicola sp. TaxID=2886825 RepID=UPI003AF2FD68